MDLLSMLIRQPFALTGIRFLHGFIGGMLVGLGFSIIARTRAPDRTLGMLLLDTDRYESDWVSESLQWYNPRHLLKRPPSSGDTHEA
jgi:hypothetical protein